MNFSIIIPTLGRPSLVRMLFSIAYQKLIDGDEILVVGDDPDGPAKKIVLHFGPPFRYLSHKVEKHPRGYGNPQRNFAMPFCKGDYVNDQDDDDMMAPGILKIMRQACEESPGKIFIYQMRRPSGRLNPGYPPTDLAGGQCFVWPNIPERMGGWGHRYTGDQDFMSSTIALHPEGKNGVIYRPEIITHYSGGHYLGD